MSVEYVMKFVRSKEPKARLELVEGRNNYYIDDGWKRRISEYCTTSDRAWISASNFLENGGSRV